MPNALLTPTAVTREALRVLHQKLNFVGSITRDYDASFAKTGAKIGDSLKIRTPNQYVVTDGATLVKQDTAEQSVTLTVNRRKHVGLNFTDVDLTLTLDDFSKRIIEPAMSVLAAVVENDAMSMYQDIGQSIWNGGSPATFNRVLDGRVILQNALAPGSGRTACLNSLDMADVVKDTKTLFQDDKSIAKQYREGYLGRAAGFDFVENTLWNAHTRGAANTAYVVNTSSGITSGSATIAVTAGAGAMNKGDVFTIADVFSVHYETKANMGRLFQFVVAANYPGGAGNVTVVTAPVTSGARQNVTLASAGAGKAMVFAGTAGAAVGTSMLFQEGAFAFATADLEMPRGVHFAAREVMDGISALLVRDYDINDASFPARLDILYGFKTLRPELAARFHNN